MCQVGTVSSGGCTYEDTKVTQNGDVYDSLTDDLMPPPVRASDIPVYTQNKQKKGIWKKILGS